MRVRTFDLLTGEQIECTLVKFTISGMATLEMQDGKRIVRHLDRCTFNKQELKEWYNSQTT